jgi:hypothetical protein
MQLSYRSFRAAEVEKAEDGVSGYSREVSCKKKERVNSLQVIFKLSTTHQLSNWHLSDCSGLWISRWKAKCPSTQSAA